MSSITRSVSTLIRARNAPCCARRAHGAAISAEEKARRETETAFFISGPRFYCLAFVDCKRFQRSSGLLHTGAVGGKEAEVRPSGIIRGVGIAQGFRESVCNRRPLRLEY